MKKKKVRKAWKHRELSSYLRPKKHCAWENSFVLHQRRNLGGCFQRLHFSTRCSSTFKKKRCVFFLSLSHCLYGSTLSLSSSSLPLFLMGHCGISSQKVRQSWRVELKMVWENICRESEDVFLSRPDSAIVPVTILLRCTSNNAPRHALHPKYFNKKRVMENKKSLLKLNKKCNGNTVTCGIGGHRRQSVNSYF